MCWRRSYRAFDRIKKMSTSITCDFLFIFISIPLFTVPIAIVFKNTIDYYAMHGQ